MPPQNSPPLKVPERIVETARHLDARADSVQCGNRLVLHCARPRDAFSSGQQIWPALIAMTSGTPAQTPSPSRIFCLGLWSETSIGWMESKHAASTTRVDVLEEHALQFLLWAAAFHWLVRSTGRITSSASIERANERRVDFLKNMIKQRWRLWANCSKEVVWKVLAVGINRLRKHLAPLGSEADITASIASGNSYIPVISHSHSSLTVASNSRSSSRSLFREKIERLPERARGRAVTVAGDRMPQHADGRPVLKRYRTDNRRILSRGRYMRAGLWAAEKYLTDLSNVLESSDVRGEAKATVLKARASRTAGGRATNAAHTAACGAWAAHGLSTSFRCIKSART
jgi:hypothetical protein